MCASAQHVLAAVADEHATFLEPGKDFFRRPQIWSDLEPNQIRVHIRRDESGAVVRYIGLDTDFTADLELDEDGLLIFYPRLARRIEPREWAARSS